MRERRYDLAVLDPDETKRATDDPSSAAPAGDDAPEARRDHLAAREDHARDATRIARRLRAIARARPRSAFLSAFGALALVLLVVLRGPLGCRGTQSAPPPGPRPPLPIVDARPYPPREEPLVRVRVVSRDTARTAIELGGVDGRFTIRRGDRVVGAALPGPLVVRRGAAGWSIRPGVMGAAVIRIEDGGDVEIENEIGRVGERTILFAEAMLPARVRLIGDRTRPTRVDLVATIPIETYLPGVLAGELYRSWPAATHRAQAIAARSFAVFETWFWAERRHFDVVAGPRSQAWTGLVGTGREFDAVRATAGEVLIFDARIVPAYYSSTCGGHAASASDAIGPSAVNAIAPLTASARSERGYCDEAPLATWTFDLGRDAFSRALRETRTTRPAVGAASRQFGRVISIAVGSRNPTGRALTLRAVDDAGRVREVSTVALRRSLNELPGDRIVRSDDFEAILDGDRVRLAGRGFGHGVGLCQYGAAELAREGVDDRGILARYYPGAAVIRAWQPGARAGSG